MSDDLISAVGKHYTDRAATAAKALDDELRAFTPDPELDRAVDALDEMRRQPSGQLLIFGTAADRLDRYRQRRDAAAALTRQPSGDDAA